MAPLTRALRTHYKEKRGDVVIYQGKVDTEWTIASIPHGGYALGLVLDAAIQSQSQTNQKDICHCTAHYIRSALPKPFEVHIQNLKIGRGFSNLTADLIQDGGVRIKTHLIFTTLPDAPAPQLPTPQSLTITRPSPFARQIPIDAPSSEVKPTSLVKKFNFGDRILWSEQRQQANKRNAARHERGEGGAEWAAWMQLTDERDAITPSTLAFFADMFRNLPESLPKGQKSGPSWFPTMVIDIQFVVKISSLYRLRTVGLWSEGRFMQDGRHDNSVEVWTAPCELEDEKAQIDADWKKEQHCLCISRQMALTLPLSVNEARATPKL